MSAVPAATPAERRDEKWHSTYDWTDLAKNVCRELGIPDDNEPTLTIIRTALEQAEKFGRKR